MLTILFADRDEAMFVYEKLLIQSVTFRYMTVKLKEDSCLYIQCKKNKEMCVQKIVIPALVEMVHKVKRKKIINEQLEEIFLFTDKIERLAIIKIAQAIIQEGHPMLTEGIFTKQKKLLIQSLQQFFLDIPETFSLDAFLQFRLKSYEDEILRVTECAIDEYKLEQEYQTFIHDVRQQVKKADQSTEIIHLYHEQHFSFYNEKFHFIATYTEKEKIIEYLIQLAPKRVYLYTHLIDHPIIVTILNIFQERVKLKQLQEFTLKEKLDPYTS